MFKGVQVAQFIAYNKRVEVSGEVVFALLKGVDAYKKDALATLKANGIDKPVITNWYPQQAYLNAFKSISEKLGPYALYEVGKMIPEIAKWPPQIKTIEEGLPSIDVAYHLNHRIGSKILVNKILGILLEGIGHYKYEKSGLRSAVMVCNNPYPCDFDRGIIEAVVNKFNPPDCKAYSVKHNDLLPCRKLGHDSCTYTIKW